MGGCRVWRLWVCDFCFSVAACGYLGTASDDCLCGCFLNLLDGASDHEGEHVITIRGFLLLCSPL